MYCSETDTCFVIACEDCNQPRTTDNANDSCENLVAAAQKQAETRLLLQSQSA